ncbi:HAMP domain-containing protein [Clostridia bacterium]|nr:HAMP domain-containing protein [Clostridia bacterium]
MKKISHKLLASYLGIIVVTFLVFALMFTSYYRSYNVEVIHKELEDQSLSIMQTLEVLLADEEASLDDARIEEYMKALSDTVGYRVTVIDPQGQVFIETNRNKDTMENHIDRQEFIDAAENGLGMEVRSSVSMGQEYIYVARPVYREGELVAFVRLSVTLKGAKGMPEQLAISLRLSMLVASLIALLTAGYLSRTISKPILQIAEVTKKVQQGDFNLKVYPQSRDEIGMLAQGINQMTSSLQGTMNRLHSARIELESILNNLSNGVVMLGCSGEIRAINQPAGQIFHVVPEKVLGQNHLQALKNHTIDRGFCELKKTHEVQHLNLDWLGEGRRYYELVMIPILNGDELESVVVSIYDITEIKLAEIIRTEFVSNASHELKTPLTAIKGFTETLLDGAMDDKETLKRFLIIIDKETTRLVRLAEDLLSLARLEKKTLRIERLPFNVKETVQKLKEQFQPMMMDRNLNLTVDIVENLPEIEADEIWINQVMVNLLENSIKYSEDGTNINIQISYDQEKNSVCIRVTDQGVGIPDDEKERVFERFYRVNKNRSRETGGTGLGLSIVKHVVEAHQGTLGIVDHEPQGTTVWFCLPIKEEQHEN